MEFSKKLDEIRNTILDKNIKVVSFDLFDTLVLRPCIEPTDLFRIVAKRFNYEGEFVNVRKVAEQYARKKKLYYYDDVTICEIYDEFAELADIPRDKAYEIMQCELQVEYDYIYPRCSVRELFNLAKENGKKVIIVTDIYMPRDFIEKVLEKNELTEYYKLYVSSEERLSKGSGRLFQKVIADFSKEGVEKQNIIHLGDNQRADVSIPKNLGMKSVHLPNAIGILNSKKQFKPLYEFGKRTDSCFLVGTLANYLFDDPFFPFNIDSFFNGNAKLLGAVLYGSILLSYTKWLIENSIENKIDKILFVMRDGYIIEKIYERLTEAYDNVPNVDTIYLSRMIRYYFKGKEKNGLLNSFSQFEIPQNMTVDEFMEKRLLLDNEEKKKVWKLFKSVGYIDVSSPMGKPVQYYLLMPKLQEIFEKKTNEEINIICEYCREKFGNTNNPAVVDVGYRGSVSRFLHDELHIRNIGFQMLEIPLSQQYLGMGYNIKSFYSYSFKNVRNLKILHHLTEDIISIQEGTAIKIEKEGNKFTIRKKAFDCENPVLQEMQKGILEFVDYAFDILKKDFIDFKFDVTIFFDMLFDFLRQPSKLDSNVIKQLSFEESDFIKIQTDKNIYNQWIEEKIGKDTPIVSVSPQTRKLVEEPVAIQSSTEVPIAIQTSVDVPVVIQPSEEENEDKPWEKISKIHLFAIKVCEKMNILDFAINVKGKLKGKNSDDEINAGIISKLFELPLENTLKCIAANKFNENGNDKKVLVAGHMTSFDKGTCNYVNQLNHCMTEYDLILMSECIHLSEERTKQKIDFPFFIVPSFLGKDRYDTQTGVVCSKKIRKYVNKKTYLKWGVDNLIKRHEDIEEDYAYLLVYYSEQFSNKMLDIIKPHYVILWNEFFAFHCILKNICNERGIKIVYLEFGSLPGTISIERLGQMGESFPGRFTDEFGRLEVSDQELAHSTKVLDFLKSSKLNRNIQPINNNVEDIKKRLKKGRPIILYAGVNDYESGLVPYTQETAKSHSPIFKSSEDALLSLIAYAEKHDCNLIYKPHPIIEKQMKSEKFYGDKVVVAINVDINDVIDIADVVVTILSQVSYTALIRGKAVVMLGYTQLKGKGCCYEAFKKDDIENVLTNAIANGFSLKMQEIFVRHIAQMNKYNLFDDLQTKPLKYGQSIEKAVDYIFNCDDTAKWYAEHCD